ncbi:MAG: response regulator [Chitinivibrionales bacterium]|nr:response regulator [Chitinivibrionales bacterium]
MKLLLVEDNDGLREQMKWALNDEYDILEADSSSACMEVFNSHSPRIVCLDLGLDNIPEKGLELIDPLLTKDRRVKIIIITAHTGKEFGPLAISKGAFDYLRKPIDINELKVLLNRAKRHIEMENPEKEVSSDAMETGPDFEMVGECGAMKKIFATIKKLSRAEVNVLITGESGTGKELCARAIHFHSPRNEQPFVPINCGAIPETLLESELFGYARGAFTGANTDKKGLIESANNGTLFLDEIADMAKHLQVKLLRFLEDYTFQRLGDTELRKSNIRIIAATNKKDFGDNEEAMRSDLYYRLSEFEINLPPLNKRGHDVIILARRAIEKYRVKFELPKLRISKRAEKILANYNWPGNVRELDNKLSRAALTCVNQTIEPEDLQLPVESINNLTLKEARNFFEKDFILNALRKTSYNIAVAAKNLGISRPTLYDLIKKHEIAIKGQEL